MNNHCSINSPVTLAKLDFPKTLKDKNELITNISMPCFYNDKEKLQLIVKTKNGNEYYKVETIARKVLNIR